jgi:biopolymer transport protein TolR
VAQDVPSRLLTIFEEKAERTVYLKADQDAPYGAVMAMMDALRKAGIETVGLITERPGATVASAEGEQQ